MTAETSEAEAATEIAHLRTDRERSPSNSTSPPAEQAEFEPAELPSFRPLPEAKRWRKDAAYAPADEPAGEEAARLDATGQIPFAGRKPQRTMAKTAPEPNEVKGEIGLSHGTRGSRLLRSVGLACMLMLGLGLGLGVAFLIPVPDVAGGSYAQHARAAVSFVAALLNAEGAPASSARHEARSPGGELGGPRARAGTVDALEGSRASVAAMGVTPPNGAEGGPWKSWDARARSDTQALPRGEEKESGLHASNTGLALLVEEAERQIANRQVERPPGDNALETYHRIAALSPQDPAATYIGEQLSTTLWSLAMDAKTAERWDDAVHYLDILNTLPPVPTAAILARSALSPTDPARNGRAEMMEQARPAEIDVIGRFEDVPTVPMPSATAEDTRLPDGSQAMVTPTSTRDVSQAAGSLALDRGDAAMRSGDVVAARRFYQVSASAGIAGAANAVARTYDPVYLRQIGVRGLQADPAAARRWYEKAIGEGDMQARTGLDRLLNALGEAHR